MAAVDTLPYHPYSAIRSSISTFPYNPSPISAVTTPSALDAFLTPAQLAALHSQWTMPVYGSDAYASAYSSPVLPPGTVVPANVVSTHGKLHKRANHKANRSKSKNDISQSVSDVALGRPKTPPASTGVSSVDGSRSPSKAITRSILKQNLRKLSQHQDDQDYNTIDLSKTAAENEERSGLGITTSRSIPNIRTAPGGFRGHSRSHSHNSQHSVSGPWEPTVSTLHPYTLPPTRSYTASNDGLDFSGDVYTPPLPEDAVRRSRGATVDSSTSDAKPKLRLITTPTETFEIPPLPALNQNNPSLTSLDRTSTRPRRSTNQSHQSANNGELNMTPLTKASLNYLTRTKTDEPVDAVTRAATIQAARQAFEDREEDKARKYEEQEQRAQSRQQRKIAKIEEKKRRKSDAVNTAANQAAQRPGSAATPARSHYSYNSNDTPERPEFRSGGEYASLESLGLPGPSSRPAHAAVSTKLAHSRSAEPAMPLRPTISKRRAVKMSYVQFVTWAKTKILNVGRRRRQHDL